MKKLKFITMLFCAFAAISLTSCLNDDDDDDNNGLSAEEIQQCYNLTRGSYTGKAYFLKDATKIGDKVNVDSTDASWAITSDSTMVLQRVSSTVLASVLKDSTLKASIAKQAPKDINCRIAYIRLSPVLWVISPSTVTYNNVEYKGKQSTVSMTFYNNYYSSGSYDPASKAMALQLVVYTVRIDGQENFSVLPQMPAALTFLSKH